VLPERNGFSIKKPACKRANVNAATITRQSKSNLALAFISLGRERRRDITVFYAFCRVIDDIADSSELSVIEKRVRLSKWRQMLHAAGPDEPLLARDVRCLIDKYSLPSGMLEEIIAGVEMDLSILRYPTFEELRVYCYRVASAVGLVSIEIFGYRNPLCKQYAIELGLALQMTNIIRDVGKDLRHGRIYLPEEDLVRFNYSETELRERQYNERFLHLMEFEAERARGFFSRAAAALPAEDRRAMAPAEIMGSVYRGLLRRIELDKFRVFEKEYRLSKMEKAGRIVAQLYKSFLNLPGRASV
jgi:15-cis-phytoene synthase